VSDTTAAFRCNERLIEDWRAADCILRRIKKMSSRSRGLIGSPASVYDEHTVVSNEIEAVSPDTRRSARAIQDKGWFPAVNAEVAKRDILATLNSLKSQGRPRLIVPMSKLRAATLKLWPGPDNFVA
jgi:hypothetical protein